MRSPEPGSAELRFETTDFPGVYLHVGQLARFDLPHCGCDACDEQPAELERQLAEIVDVVVNGRSTEFLSPTHVGFRYDADRGSTSSESRLLGDHPHQGMPPFETTFMRWPDRES